MIDLHCHSRLSDGSDPPRRVVELAELAGCVAVALTDHDGLFGLAEAAARADELGITFVPGCEVSCAGPGTSIHLLCYFLADSPGPLQDELVQLQFDREARNAVLIGRLVELGLPITYEEVVAEAGQGAVGRPHFAAVLVRNGAADSIDDAFARYLGRGRPGHIGRTRVDPRTVIELATASGAVTALAHPLSLELGDKLEDMVASLRDAGLVGLESYYGRYDPPTRDALCALAHHHGLVPTGGSDYHGRYKPGLQVGTGEGDLTVPDYVLTELIERRP